MAQPKKPTKGNKPVPNKRTPQTSTLKKRAFLEAYVKTLGNISASCIAVGIDRKTHYNWLKADPLYAEEIKDVHHIQGDFVEGALFTSIQAGNIAAILFWLKNKGQDRGYFPDAYHVVHGTTANGKQRMTPPTIVLNAPTGYDPDEDLQLLQ